MSIFSRLFKIGEAKANQVVDSLEKPELMLEQAIKDKAKQIREAKKSVMSVIATERQTRALLLKEQNEKSTWEAKAQQALKSGREDLAVKALTRSQEHEQKAVQLEQTWKAQKTSVDQLKLEIVKMEDELAEFKRNKDFIIAQAKTAEVKKQIYQAKANMQNDRSADDLMARMKAKAERASFEADAAEEMAEQVTGDSLEKEFAQLGGASASADVTAKLEAMKKQLGSGS
ncbi:MAG TPA: PspA/IM30 family protein [Caldithrix abyssi]|uniref:PspA/IM30 family protein n=1 Tax=Caldithrix abyssi TaxID=187145 RepID=A0A7V1PV64_CALAY|nr:PspA/IM30 family protein [Caldithrix abyssi]